jgi:PKD repeat protein
MYFTNSIISNGNALCGYAYFPGGPETILMAYGCTTSGNTFSHEMGHFFALPHTHGNSNVPGSSQELVDGSNCETTGDFICDTPADPLLGFGNVSSACIYTGSAQDANFDFYQPDPTNIMSYSRPSCSVIFSPQQYARMNAVLQISRNNLTCPSFNADFIADQTSTCTSNFTVNFTDNSVGATSWAWDVDGDDIIDYTTQNPVHTYNTSGSYDVVLTVSDGTTNINKVKSNYINVGSLEINTATIELTLNLDDTPSETTWQFLDSNNNVLYSGGPYTGPFDANTTRTATFNINPDECYSFEINDSLGNGICCANGNGSYEL